MHYALLTFHFQNNSNIYTILQNKRAQRALGRSPEEKVTVEPIIENPRGII